jgi:hypothetical protein
MISHRVSLSKFSRRAAGMLALAAAWLFASPAGAFLVVFDGPSGYGTSSSSAAGAFEAGFTRLNPVAISQPADFGITIPEPVVLSASLNSSPSLVSLITATSTWTVQNPGRALQDAWLVFLKPLTYSPSLVGIDLQAGGQWGLVAVSAGSTEYFYPAVSLGLLPNSGSVQFTMHHALATLLTQQGNTYVLPKYGVGILGVVPGPAVLPLLAMAFAGLVLRRRSTV